MGYATVESLLDDVSRQMASSNLTKYSRGSNGQRASGGSMRIVKPSSTSNSPRGSIGLGRRRTVMTDRRRIAMADQNMATAGGFISNDGLQIPTRSSRPVSWHPSSQKAQQPHFPSAYQVPTLQTQSDFHLFDLSPAPAVFSGYGSPDSSFSPLSIPYTGYEQNYPYTDNAIPYQSHHGYSFNQPVTQTTMPYNSAQSGSADSAMQLHSDWNHFAANGFETSTSPPTPEFFLPIQHPESTLPADDAIPYHSLSDSEPEGEILQGLGLYDTPEVSKPLPSAPQFDNYPALVMAPLLGPAYQRLEPESTGKGLKLEETWNPPPSDDEDDEEEDDDEQDGEGEDDDEPVAHYSNAKDETRQRSNGFMDATNLSHNGMQTSHGLHSSWL
jgi:hypothetical protein